MWFFVWLVGAVVSHVIHRLQGNMGIMDCFDEENPKEGFLWVGHVIFWPIYIVALIAEHLIKKHLTITKKDSGE